MSEHNEDLVGVAREIATQLKHGFEMLATSHFGLATKQDLHEMEKRIMATQADIIAALTAIDTATTAIANSIASESGVIQTISDEVNALVAAVPAGTVITDDQITQLQSLASRAQDAANSLTAQVPVLQGIASKGAANPVPVPVPPNIPAA